MGARKRMGMEPAADDTIVDGATPRVPRADAVRNRARVLAATWRLLSQKRPDELSMEDVAREADIGKGTLYRHYPTKECLFDALVHEGSERIAAAMRERIPPEADASTKLRAVVALVYDAYENYRISIDFLLGVHISDDAQADSRPRTQSPAAAIVARVRGILEQGMREGAFRPLDLDYTAAAVFSLINPIAFIKQREKLGYSRVELEERVNDLLAHALRNTPGEY